MTSKAKVFVEDSKTAKTKESASGKWAWFTCLEFTIWD